ncbi:Tektin-3 [Echinococcus granulosus]|uniref:Tektin n=1 Tax=Echinococcus granulosus TaxID=6210 RepID=A0A068WPW5_ECHGR|nr:Tektin-3 [Echinococcus granulosus]CDS20543.1 tektin 3 [Echinococcus granulosus]
MEFLGHFGGSCYMPASRHQQITARLPTLATLPPLNPTLPDACPRPYPHRRSLAALAYRPANYYSAAKVSPTYPLTASQVDSTNADTQLNEACGIRVPSLYSAARTALYTRYTPRNWFDSYNRLLQANDLAQKNSDCLAHDSKRLEEELADRAKTNQNVSTRRLGDRICDTAFWQSEVDSEIAKMKQEIDDQIRARRVTEKLLAETENHLHVTQECLYNREKRQCTDLVHDDVEKRLIEEVNTVRCIQDELRSLIDDAKTQEQLNRAALHDLEVDKARKFRAIQLDESAHSMHNSSAHISYYEGVECIDQTQSVPETWNKQVSDLIQRSQSERAASRMLRERIAKGIAHASKTLSDIWEVVNAAFAQRIREFTDARNQLQASLGKTLQAIFDTEKEIEDLKKAIKDKEEYLKTATSRLNTRLLRPGVENCRDPAMVHLICEVKQLKAAIEELTKQLRRAEGVLQELLHLRTAKEGELACKNNSLFIDRECCLALRTQWPGGPTAGAANAIPCPGNIVSSVQVCTCK